MNKFVLMLNAEHWLQWMGLESVSAGTYTWWLVALQALYELLFTGKTQVQVVPILQLCRLTQLAKGRAASLSPWAGSLLAQSCAVPCPGRLESCSGPTVLSKCQSCKLSA